MASTTAATSVIAVLPTATKMLTMLTMPTMPTMPRVPGTISQTAAAIYSGIDPAQMYRSVREPLPC